jgi:hypothetical protein
VAGFASELALLAVLAVAGAAASMGLAWRIVLAVAGPVLAVAIWGLLIAPRARHRLRDPVRLAAETVLFAASSVALALAGQVLLAAVFAILAIGSFVSLMSANGASIELIARLVGHTTTATTEAVYRHELRPIITEGAEIIGKAFGSGSPQAGTVVITRS